MKRWSSQRLGVSPITDRAIVDAPLGASSMISVRRQEGNLLKESVAVICPEPRKVASLSDVVGVAIATFHVLSRGRAGAQQGVCTCDGHSPQLIGLQTVPQTFFDLGRSSDRL